MLALSVGRDSLSSSPVTACWGFGALLTSAHALSQGGDPAPPIGLADLALAVELRPQLLGALLLTTRPRILAATSHSVP